MFHQTFDLDHWISVFPLVEARHKATEWVRKLRQDRPDDDFESPLEEHIAGSQPGGEQITSPCHLVIIEQIRREVLSRIEGAEGLETDLFVFNTGEAPQREMTKVGGLPYWPAERKWPANDAGEPMTFVGQFCFVDSRDLVPELPGDILLIFCSTEGLCWHEPDALRLEWAKLGVPRLIEPDEVPKTAWAPQPVWGSICRYFDWLEPESMFEDYNGSYLLDVTLGTKIGGLPNFIQGAEDLPGTFLCGLASTFPDSRGPFPFINRSEPLVWEDRASLLMWGDVGCLYIFIDDAGALHWTIQCG